VVAHDSTSIGHDWREHYSPLAKKIFYTKTQSNARFVNVGEQASDSAPLDGMDSTDFAGPAHAHSGDDITSGTVDESVIDTLIARVADVFDIVLANDGSGSGLDADLLDGLSSEAFALAAEVPVQWHKESVDPLATTTTSERVVFTAPLNVTITDIFVEPAGAVTADNRNYATITVYRRNSNGANQVVVASETTQLNSSGRSGDWASFKAVSLGTLSNTSATPGRKLTIEITKQGGGVILPVLTLQIEYTVG
jgi:hypothetical protein